MSDPAPNRFFDLAMKSISGQADEKERAELEKLKAEDESLEKEYIRLKAESEVLKETIPLAEATQATEGEFPEWARANLQLEVEEVFGKPEVQPDQESYIPGALPMMALQQRIDSVSLPKIGPPADSPPNVPEEKMQAMEEPLEAKPLEIAGCLLFECPQCQERFEAKDVKWVANHPALKGDPLLGSDAYLRFLPNRFSGDKAMDPMGNECTKKACPKCHAEISFCV